jgi:MvaI/BcnI restriction endonuclease family
VNFLQLQSLFVQAGCVRLLAKSLAPNDNSKNQIYFAGAVEALNVFPSEEVFAENTKKGPSFKARLRFGWLLDNGNVAPAAHAQLILYSQYPEVRFSGFLKGCKAGPSDLMADRQRAKLFPKKLADQLVDRILFLGVTADRRTLGYTVAGNSEIAFEFRKRNFPKAFEVFYEVPLPLVGSSRETRAKLLAELRRINRLGWIDSKQLDSNRQLKPCNAPQCGGYTLEAEFGIPKNSSGEPDFLGWEIKQHSVSSFQSLAAGAITLMTPEPTGGFYKEQGVEAFVRKFGYADKMDRPDRMNFGGVHRVGERHKTTHLKMILRGYNASLGGITDANGCIALVSDTGEVAAAWAFSGLLAHWSRKHSKAVYVPSQCRKEPQRQYIYGNRVRLAQQTDSLRLLKALSMGEVYYDPGIKLENISSENPSSKKRSQFRIASKNIAALYETVETVEV